jgi:hypothetical protein
MPKKRKIAPIKPITLIIKVVQKYPFYVQASGLVTPKQKI